ncbi:unnamed protein product, partial [Adineta ricciae]
MVMIPSKKIRNNQTSSVRRADSLHPRLWKTDILSAFAINEANQSSNFTYDET